MKRALLVVVLVLGCGGDVAREGGVIDTGYPSTLSTTWTVVLNEGQAPSCTGPLTLVTSQAFAGAVRSLSGSWSCTERVAECSYLRDTFNQSWQCISYSGPVTGIALPAGGISMDLDTAPSEHIDFTGQITNTAIVGNIVQPGGNIPFAAVRD